MSGAFSTSCRLAEAQPQLRHSSRASSSVASWETSQLAASRTSSCVVLGPVMERSGSVQRSCASTFWRRSSCFQRSAEPATLGCSICCSWPQAISSVAHSCCCPSWPMSQLRRLGAPRPRASSAGSATSEPRSPGSRFRESCRPWGGRVTSRSSLVPLAPVPCWSFRCAICGAGGRRCSRILLSCRVLPTAAKLAASYRLENNTARRCRRIVPHVACRKQWYDGSGC